MSNPTGIGTKGLSLVKVYEGFRSRPYWDRPMPDPMAVRTIGYGTTRIGGRGILATDRMTEPKASSYLVAQINSSQYAGALTNALNIIGVTLNQNEYDAVLSAVYNLGAGILAKNRSLGDALRSHNWRSQVAKALPLYSEPGSSVHEGLLRRRNDEVKLFKTAVANVRPIKLSPTEKKYVDQLRSERRSAKRHGGWSKIDDSHLGNARKAQAWLHIHARAMAKDKVKDTSYRDRKVAFFMDVADNKNGKGI